MDLVRDDLNPKFVHFSRITAQDIAAAGGALDGASLAAHVDEAIATWCSDFMAKAKPFDIAGDLTMETLSFLTQPGTLRIDLWVEDLDETSCTYGFLCSSENGSAAYARGERTLVKVDPRSHRPSRWSDDFRATNAGLKRDFHAYA